MIYFRTLIKMEFFYFSAPTSAFTSAVKYFFKIFFFNLVRYLKKHYLEKCPVLGSGFIQMKF